MSHVFPLRKTLPALRRLALVAGLALVVAGAAKADEKVYACGTVESTEAIVATHPAYVAHIVVPGVGMARGINVVQPGVLEPDTIETALLVLRTDGALVVIGFGFDGRCGSLVIPPGAAEAVWRAVRGTNS